MEEKIMTRPAVLPAEENNGIEIQIATARKYPRDLGKVMGNIERIALSDPATSSGCFYRVKKGKSEITGLSVRMAEIFAACWGNLRCSSRILGHDGRRVTAQGICWDLESNVARCAEVQRSITYSNGATFSDEMITITGNAAASIAYRNAVLSVIPRAVTAPVVERIRRAALEEAGRDLAASVEKMLRAFEAIGVGRAEVLAYLKADGPEGISPEHLVEMRGIYTAIEEGDVKAAEIFGDGHAGGGLSARLAARKKEGQ